MGKRDATAARRETLLEVDAPSDSQGSAVRLEVAEARSEKRESDSGFAIGLGCGITSAAIDFSESVVGGGRDVEEVTTDDASDHRVSVFGKELAPECVQLASCD
jgi:hypothetical protein